MTALLVAGLGALLVGLWVAWVYRSRELPIPGRGWLAALRIAVVAIVILLLADPLLPGGAAAGPVTRWLVVDGSRSMGVSGESAESPWERARTRVGEADDRTRVALLQDSMGSVANRDSVLARDPVEGASRLAPLLRRAAESGAREVTVVSDLRIADGLEVAALRDALGVELRFVDVGEAVRSAGIAGLSAPETGRASTPAEVTVEVFGTLATSGEEARVEVLRDGEPVGEEQVRLPGAGRTISVTLPVALPDSAGSVLWTARVALPDDRFPADDTRSAFTDVDPLEGLVALLSWRPNWEPRFVLPVLARVTGLPARGWLAVGNDAWLPMDGSGGVLDGAAASRVADDARVLVVHGLTGDAPEWLVRAQATGRRVVVFAGDREGAESAGMSALAGRPGEWYAAAASGPLAGALTGVPWADLPPLSSPLAADSSVGVGLALERTGGERLPGLVLQDRGTRRRAVVAADGFWRWGFRGDTGADAYDRLWSGVAGWLLALDDGGLGGRVGPLERVAAADAEVPWSAVPAAGGRVAVTSTGADGGPRTDTLAVGADGRARLPGRAAGSYRWTAEVLAPDSVAARGRIWSGRLEIEAHTDELRWPRDTTLLAASAAPARADLGPSGRPLRTSPWPYLLLLVLLSAEWILRRRAGLR
ncbi:MAG: VWA domain-containing protein [Gemmatimonadetes bacterium]|nr:VWA domain-containing protein [Gemmatimonadota bacterium]